MRSPRLKAAGISTLMGLGAVGVLLVGSAPSARAEVAPQKITTIAESYSQASGSTETVQGYVTADFTQGGIGVVVIQQSGSGGRLDPTDTRSEAIPVRGVAGLQLGQFVQITGTLTDAALGRELDTAPAQVTTPTPPTGATKPTPISSLDSNQNWDDSSVLSRMSWMLVKPQGTFAVTGLDEYGVRGEVDLVPGTEPRSAGDTSASGAALILDDGAADEFTANADTQKKPLPTWGDSTPPRVGDHVTFTGPNVLMPGGSTGVSGGWHVQPTTPLSSQTTTFTARITEPKANQPAGHIDVPEGDVRVAQVDLGNYFPRKAEVTSPQGTTCTVTKTAAGADLAVASGGGCPYLGAADEKSFAVQQSKIVALLTNLDGATVIAVQGVQNDAALGEKPGTSLTGLASALNTAEKTQRWKAVAPPEGAVGPWSNGFLYDSTAVAPVGSPQLSADQAFYASSSPVAQKFTVAEKTDGTTTSGGTTTKEPVTLVSARFASQSSSDYDGDLGQNQLNGANATRRKAQASALATWVGHDLTGQRVVITGNLGSLSTEAPVTTLVQAGYHDAVPSTAATSHGGDVRGSMTHVLSTGTALKASVWDVSASFAPALGYAMAGLNGSDLVQSDSPERATSENPVVFALDLERSSSADGTTPSEGSGNTAGSGSGADKGSGTGDTGSTGSGSGATSGGSGAGSGESGSTSGGSSTDGGATHLGPPATTDPTGSQTATDPSDSGTTSGTLTTASGAVPLTGTTSGTAASGTPTSTDSQDSAPQAGASTDTSSSGDTRVSASAPLSAGAAPAESAPQAGAAPQAETAPQAAAPEAPSSVIHLGSNKDDQQAEASGQSTPEQSAPSGSSGVLRGILIASAIALSIAAVVAIVIRRRMTS